MPRNKIAKRTKKRQTTNNILVNVEKMEKDLLRIPAKLAAKLKKEINAHERKETKLTKAVNKANAVLQKAETRLQAALNAKTAPSKKALKKAKNVCTVTAKAHAELSNQLGQLSSALEALSNKQDKLISLEKHISQFEKEWAKASKKTKAAEKSKKVKTKSIAPDLTIIEQTKAESYQQSSDAGIDEPVEIAS